MTSVTGVSEPSSSQPHILSKWLQESGSQLTSVDDLLVEQISGLANISQYLLTSDMSNQDYQAIMLTFREEYVNILKSNATTLTPQEVYDAATEVHEAQLKAFHLFGKALEVKLTGHEDRIRKMDNFLHKKINANDSGTNRCMQVSLNYLLSRWASELDIFINKVKVITREDTMLLTELRDAQVAAFPEYSQARDDLDDDEQKKDDQNPSVSNPSQSSKPSGSKSGEKKEEDDKKDEKKKRRSERRSKKLHDGSEPHQTLKIQTQLAQTSAQPKTTTISNIKPPQTSKPKFLYKQTTNYFLKIPITSSQTNLNKMTTLPLAKPSLKFKHISVWRKPVAFPKAYLYPNQGIVYVCPITKQARHLLVPKHYVRSNMRLIMTLQSNLKYKSNKKHEDVEMIKILDRYLLNSDIMLPNTQYNLRKDKDDDEQKDDKQKPSGSNPSQASKATGIKDKSQGENKEDEKKDGESKRRGERRSKQKHDGSEPQQTLKIQTNLAQPSKPTPSIIKPHITSKPKFLYKQTVKTFLKTPITSNQTSLKKITNLPLDKPSLKIHYKIVGRKPKKAKDAEKVQVTERANWNCFKQIDFLPLNWCILDEDYFQQIDEKIVRVWVVSLREVRIYYEDGSFTFLGCALMDSLSHTEIKRVISFLKDKDTATRAWRLILAEWLIEREERRKRNEAEYEERIRKYDEEIEMFIKRLEELKAKGTSGISKDGKFLNINAGKFLRFKIDLLDSGYPKADRLKLVEALSGTPIIEELEILDYLKDLIRKEAEAKTVLSGCM
ncbi:hypothetical protein AgCh_022680 [Apium graveolens]